MVEAFCGSFPVEEIESASGLDAVIFGVPYEDGISLYQPGTKKGSTVIREGSHFFSGQSLIQQSIHQQIVLDYGDIAENLSYDKLLFEVSKRLQEIQRKESKAIILGGDHSIALGTAKGISEGKIPIDAIVWLDAHLDLMNAYPENEKYNRTTVLRRISEEKIVKEEDIFILGCRGHNLGIEEVNFAKENDINLINAQTFHRNTERITELLSKIRNKYDHLYLSVDLDVVDPAFCPGVSVPEPAGILPRELVFIIRQLAKKTHIMEIVEFNPRLDFQHQTANVAIKTIFEFFDHQ
jgi:arginase family enzyme